MKPQIHKTAVIERPCAIGEGTKIWHFCHVMAGAKIGKNCSFGQGCHVAGRAVVEDDVRVQNGVSLYDGVVIERDAFLGPHCVFTNVRKPRAGIEIDDYKITLVKEGATIGANATIVCDRVVGKHAFVGAGAVLTVDAPNYGVMLGNPAELSGWMCECGQRLPLYPTGYDINITCAKCDRKYVQMDPTHLMRSSW